MKKHISILKKLLTPRNLSPIEIVKKLNETIEGQEQAKILTANTLRNVYRRHLLSLTNKEAADEVYPQHILASGPTGTGKTEIFTRVSNILYMPILKVAATNYTEIGYVGNDITSTIEDLVTLVKNKITKQYHNILYDICYKEAIESIYLIISQKIKDSPEKQKYKQQLKEELLAGELDDKEIEIQISNSDKGNKKPSNSNVSVFMSATLDKIFNSSDKKKKTVTIANAIQLLTKEEINKRIDSDIIEQKAVDYAENHGIIFIDEIDKLCKTDPEQRGGVSTKGVQRDLLALLSGTDIETKYGIVSTKKILFITAGAFHSAKISDLSAELQGRLPIQIKFESLTKENLINILNNPIKGLIAQNTNLLSVENIKIEFTNQAIDAIAQCAVDMNNKIEDVGARRLMTIMTHLMQHLSFDSCNSKKTKHYKIDHEYVNTMLKDMIEEKNLDLYFI